MADVVPPVRLSMMAHSGTLIGRNGRYERFLGDLVGLYRDDDAYQRLLAADNGDPVYWVETSQTEEGPGGLITGISTLEPGKVGEEFFMTGGHLHAIADRSELYVGLSGQGVMILETLDGATELAEVVPGRAVYVPGHWVHRCVNVGEERFVTLFCYAADAGQDYSIIERAGGMASLVVEVNGRWSARPNPDHRGYHPQRRP